MSWETVEVPRGSYIGWGVKPGQQVTGRIVDYDPTGATDFAGEPVPHLEVELTEACESYTKTGDRFDFGPGELVALSCSQAQLKRIIRKAELKIGMMVRITLTGQVKSASGNTVKEFSVELDRSGATHQSESAAAQQASRPARPKPGGGWENADDSEPPF
jgi:hypothetical protein